MPTVSSIVSHKKRLTARCKGHGQRQSNWPIRALRGVFSVTRWSELARQGMANADTQAGTPSFLATQLAQSSGPIIAATDCVRAAPETVRAYLPPGRSYTTFGTDGFGRSDTRTAMREFFGVDAARVVRAAFASLSARSV